MQTIIGKNYPKQVIPLIDGAKHSIKIVVYDWRWYENEPANACQLFNSAILRARKRAVDIKCCVNSEAIALPLRQNDIEVKIPVSKNLMHTKFIIIDDQILIMGSHNFSESAFTTNFETSVIIDDALQINDFVLLFHSLWEL